MLRLVLGFSITLLVVFGLYSFLGKKAISPTLQAKIPYKEAQNSGLEYLNELRVSTGLKAFSYSQTLEKAARNHTLYIKNLDTISHNESQNNAFFTGIDPSSRALSAGHKTSFVRENISAKHLSLEDSIDGLMSAIYHRFGFLSYELDEVGYYHESAYYVFEMSNSKISKLCAKGDSIGRWYITEICDIKRKAISKENFDLATKPKNPLFIAFPNAKAKSVATFGSEDPDPLPNCKITAPPVSIEFNPNYSSRLIDFKLFDENGEEIKENILLNKGNDRNGRFSSKQFALFSIKPFDFGKNYKAFVSYEQDGQNKQTEWSFGVKEPSFDYFVIQKDDVIELESGKSYELFFAPKNCNDILEEYSYNAPFGSKLKVVDSGTNILRLSANGFNGDVISLNTKLHNVKIIIKNSEEKFDYKLIFVMFLATMAYFFIARKVIK